MENFITVLIFGIIIIPIIAMGTKWREQRDANQSFLEKLIKGIIGFILMIVIFKIAIVAIGLSAIYN